MWVFEGASGDLPLYHSTNIGRVGGHYLGIIVFVFSATFSYTPVLWTAPLYYCILYIPVLWTAPLYYCILYSVGIYNCV